MPIKKKGCRSYVESTTQQRTRRYEDGTVEKDVAVTTAVKRCPGEAPDSKPTQKPDPKPSPKPLAYNDYSEGRFEDSWGTPDAGFSERLVLEPLPPICLDCTEPLPPICLDGTVDFFV